MKSDLHAWHMAMEMYNALKIKSNNYKLKGIKEWKQALIQIFQILATTLTN